MHRGNLKQFVLLTPFVILTPFVLLTPFVILSEAKDLLCAGAGKEAGPSLRSG